MQVWPQVLDGMQQGQLLPSVANRWHHRHVVVGHLVLALLSLLL